LQQARMQAVRSNTPVYANYNSSGIVFANGDPTVAFAAGNPDVALASGLSFATTPPDASQLNTYLGGTPTVPTNIGFNARGLPCTTAGNPAICTTITSGFEWFIKNGRGGWEAITVTPAGRIKSWRLSGMNGSTGVWQ